MEKAVIFDLDGTLWDSGEQVYKIWNSVFEKYPEISTRVSQRDLDKFMGKTMDEIEEMLFPDLDVTLRSRIMDECSVEEAVYLSKHGALLYDGVRETVDVLKKDYGLYIVSNCQEGYIEAFLHAHGFEADFNDIEMTGRTGKKKSENIRILMERNHIKEAVYVGDTATDEEAARSAGIPFIYATYGFGKALSPDGVIDRLTDLPDVIEKI